MRKIGIFGGTFDPIHFGHLRPALEILDVLSLHEMRFIPTGQPPHRGAPAASVQLRLDMLKAAIAGEPRFLLDEREIRRGAPSYTVDTLAELRREFPHDALLFTVGMDAFLGFPGWHQWQRIFDYAHVVIAHRPGWRLQDEGILAAVVRQRRAVSANELLDPAGGRVHFQPVTQLEISSTQVRACITTGGDPRYLVPETVRELIKNSHCYMQPAEP